MSLIRRAIIEISKNNNNNNNNIDKFLKNKYGLET